MIRKMGPVVFFCEITNHRGTEAQSPFLSVSPCLCGSSLDVQQTFEGKK